MEGASLGFSAVINDPGTADTHTYSWTFGDGGSSTAASPNHTYADDGTYTVSLTVTPVDDVPTATADSATVAEGAAA